MKIVNTNNLTKMATKENFRIFHEPYDDGSDLRGGYLNAFLGPKKIGTLFYSLDRQDQKTVHVESVHVDQAFRKHGVAKRLMQEFINLMRKKYHWIEHVTGDFMSRTMLQMHNQLFGKPQYLGTWKDQLTDEPQKAMKHIPPVAEENDDGGLDGPTIFGRHKMRNRVKKKDLQSFKPFHTQQELPFDHPKQR